MRNGMLDRRAGVGMIMLAAWGLLAGARAETVPPLTRVLHFSRDRCLGGLYVEDPCLGSEYRELGRDLSLPYGLDPRRLALGGDWDFVSLARGDVAVPIGRNIKLLATLQLLADRNRLAAPTSREYKIFRVDRRREDPEDLSGLSELDPNGLWGLTVNRLMPMGQAGERVLEPISRLTGLRVLELHGTGITDRGMEHLRPLRSLRALEFSRESFVGNRGLAVLKDLPNLEYLDLDTGATDVGFKYLGQSRSLRWLRIRTGRIWGPGLAELTHLPRLERLCIWGTTEISDRHIQYLEGLTQLKSLTLWSVADGLTDASLASISKLKNLEELHFIRTMPRFTPAGVACLKNLKKLREIEFAQAWSGPQGVPYGDEVARQLAGMPGLESIRGMAYLSAEGIKTLATLPNLKCLDVAPKDRRQGYDGPTGISHLVRLRKLEELTFTGGKFLSDADVAQFESLDNLRHLFIGFSEVTDRGMASLGKLRRLEHLTISTDSAATMTKRGLNELKGLTNLQTLDVRVVSKAKAKPAIDEIPLTLSSLTNLKTLELSGMALQDGDLPSLGGMGNLEWLILEGSFTENGLWRLKDLHSLKFMRMHNISCSSGEGLTHLAELKKLTDLGLDGQITDAALGHMAGFPSLWSLTVRTDESIRPETIDRLRQTLPTGEYIHIDPLTHTNPQGLGMPSRQSRPVRPNPPQNPRRLR